MWKASTAIPPRQDMAEGLVTVTGASGYIGSYVVANLLAKGKKVRATVRDVEDPIKAVSYTHLTLPTKRIV